MPIYFLSFPELLFLLPLFGCILILLFPQKQSKIIALSVSVLILLINLLACFYAKFGVQHPMNSVVFLWLNNLGSNLILRLDSMSLLLSLLTSIAFVVSIILTNKDIKKIQFYFCLIFALQLGLYGVFLSFDLLCFYIFWEIVLIPTYFLCAYWGGSNALKPTLKFFLYTFLGSLCMLIGIIYLYINNPNQSFSFDSLIAIPLTNKEQYILTILFVFAFAIKMPIFPFHTWQPKLYSTAPLSITILLSSVMVKMGLLGVIRWVLPFFPNAIQNIGIYIIIFSVIGIVYASLIAIKQNELKLILAYSSIAHIGLMCATIFTQKQQGIEGVILQMFNHGINIIGLWILVDVFEKKYNSSNIKNLGGIISNNSYLGFLFIIFTLANIALPLTNSFVAEFAMLNSLFIYNNYIGIIASLTIIFSAVYMLRTVDFAILGSPEKLQINTNFNLQNSIKIITIFIVIIIFAIGIYSKPIFQIINNTIGLRN